MPRYGVRSLVKSIIWGSQMSQLVMVVQVGTLSLLESLSPSARPCEDPLQLTRVHLRVSTRGSSSSVKGTVNVWLGNPDYVCN
jgi:hypothetical protein